MSKLRGSADRTVRRRYRGALGVAVGSGVPFLIGGGYGLEYYTGIRRPVAKDLDLFVRREDVKRLLHAFDAAGFRTELRFPHWLAKIHVGHDCIDVIWSSGNGVAKVDDVWFQHSVPTAVLGYPVRLSPPEEMIWSKAFVMERERYDGADIAHLIRGCHAELDWPRLVSRFGEDWRVLLNHLVLFGYIYPGERDAVPAWVLAKLTAALMHESAEAPSHERLCRGTRLSRGQYLTDIQHWGYQDARLIPYGTMTTDEVVRWTDAIGEDEQNIHADCGGR